MTWNDIDSLTKLLLLGAAIVGLVRALWSLFRSFGGDREIIERISQSNISGADKKVLESLFKVHRAPWIALATVSFLIVAFVFWNLTATSTREQISRSLDKHEPKLFSGGQSELYEFARVFPDKASLERHSALRTVINDTEYEFDLFSDHALSVLEMYEEALFKAIERGVKVRVVLLDRFALESGNSDELLIAMNRDKDFLATKLDTAHKMLTEWQSRIKADRNMYKGSLDVRSSQHPVFHRMWIRDASTENAMAHVTVLQYRGRVTPPSFRVTRKTSNTLIDELSAEFEHIWNGADHSTPK